MDEVKKATGRSDLTVKTQAVTAQNRIPRLYNGTMDIACGFTTNNPERARQGIYLNVPMSKELKANPIAQSDKPAQ